MKQVCVNAWTCSATRSTTSGAALPTLVTAMPEREVDEGVPVGVHEHATTGRLHEDREDGADPAGDVAVAPLGQLARDTGPGISVTSRRSWGRPGPPL